MQLSRWIAHLGMTAGRVRRAFPAGCLDAIEQAIGQAESTHDGEICFVIEGALHPAQLLRGLSPRARALEVFAQQRVWDTEHNNGVLIYVLLADRAVEIVADRHIHARAGTAAWAEVARAMEQDFARGEFRTGALAGVAGVAAELARHYPGALRSGNQLPDRPTLL